MTHPVKMDFLREFPFVLGKEQRIQFLAVAYVGDVIINTYSELFNVVTELSGVKDQSKVDTEQRNQVFRLSWEVVEHAHSMYKLMCASDKFFTYAPGFSELKHFLNDASKLRDKKVHMFQNIKNLVKQKKLNYLHGIVKWTYDTSNDQQPSSYFLKLVTIEPMTHNINFNFLAGIEPINAPVDNLILEAFGYRLNITRFISTFNKYVTTLEDRLKETAIKLEQSGKMSRVDDLNEAERVPLYVTLPIKEKIN